MKGKFLSSSEKGAEIENTFVCVQFLFVCLISVYLLF